MIAIGFLLACMPTFAQKRTISGYVMDAASKETLIGATVFDKNSGKGCATNSYGFYTLTLNQGQVELQVSYVGYTQQNQSIDLKENLNLNFALETNIELGEVVVEATRATVSARSPRSRVQGASVLAAGSLGYEEGRRIKLRGSKGGTQHQPTLGVLRPLRIATRP